MNKWKAQIGIKNQRYCISFFDTPEDAAEAYDKEAVKCYGKFAKLNFPPLLNQYLAENGLLD